MRSFACGLLIVGLTAGAIPAIAVAATPIHAGDKLSITIFNHTDLSTLASVTSRGDVPVPVAGDVRVAGLDEDAAARSIERAMSSYLRHPAVNVRIVQEGQSLFFTGAAVAVQPYQPGETLGAAIGALAHPTQGGTAPDLSVVDLRHVDVTRDGQVVSHVNLEALSRSGDAGPTLDPGDVISLRTKPIRVDVRGDLRAPTTVYVDAGETLEQAVDQAGGFGQTTSLAHITLRRGGEDETISEAGETMMSPAHDGDVVILQPAPHVTVLGTVPKPGDELLAVRPTLLGALYAAGGPNQDADLRHIKLVHDGTTRYVDLYGMTRGDLSADTPLHDGDLVFVPRGHRIDATAFLGALGVLASLKYLVIK